MVGSILFVSGGALHFCAGYQPFAVVEVELGPFHMPQITWSAEQQRGQFQGAADGKGSAVVIHCIQQCAELFRIRHGGKVFDLLSRECPGQISNLVRGCNARSLSKLEDLFVYLRYTTCCFGRAALDDSLKIFYEERSGNAANWELSKPRVGI